jgi:hypothetical protein
MECNDDRFNDLETKEANFLQLQELIDAKRKMLLDKQKNFTVLTKQNHFLRDMKDDYSRYYKHIAQQKEDQMAALNLLKEYVQDLTTSGSLTRNNIKDAETEQENLLREVKAIKASLDSLVNKTRKLESDL